MIPGKLLSMYIGRYLARAAIAEYRIVSYDGEEITFWYTKIIMMDIKW